MKSPEDRKSRSQSANFQVFKNLEEVSHTGEEARAEQPQGSMDQLCKQTQEDADLLISMKLI